MMCDTFIVCMNHCIFSTLPLDVENTVIHTRNLKVTVFVVLIYCDFVWDILFFGVKMVEKTEDTDTVMDKGTEKMDAIAIDGPAGAGKSTIAKDLARCLEMTYVDTGAMYRAIAVWVGDNDADPADEAEVERLLEGITMSVGYEEGVQRVYLGERDVTDRLRAEETGRIASVVSKYGAVRRKLVELQQQIAAKEPVIMDGRDIGTKVLPDAVLKIFMTASPDVRAKRRFDELMDKGVECDYDDILEDIKKRDHADETRTISPLKPADDAVILDTSDMTQDEVVEKIEKLYDELKGR